MKTHPNPSRWWHLPSRVLGLAGLVWVAVSPGAAAAAATTTTTSTLSQPPPGASWSAVSPPTSPPPLAYATAAYDSDNNTVVVFGGRGAGGALSNDTWVWDGSTWTDYPGSRQLSPPPARQMASMAFDPKLHQLILFGGQGAGGQLLGDTWAWNGLSWVAQTGRQVDTSPAPREGAAMAYDGAGHLVLFGGTGAAQPAVSQTSPPSGTSTTSPGTTGPGTTPSTTTAAGQSVVLGDTSLWTASGWVASPAGGPPPRSGASLAFDNAHGALLFGGQSTPEGTSTPSLLGDSWVWNGSAWNAASPPTSPPAREDAAMAGDPDAGGVVLFGGYGASGLLADTWVWDGSGWAQDQASGPPSPRAGSAMAFNADSHQLVLLGGAGPGGSPLGGTEIMTRKSPVPINPSPLTTSPSTSSPPTSSQMTTSQQEPSGRTTRTGLRPPPQNPITLAPPGTLTAGQNGQPNSVTAAQTLHRGDLVTLSGGGFRPGTVVTISFHSAPTVVGRAVAGPTGVFTATVAVPENAADGMHHFQATGLGPAGKTTQLVAAVRVAALPMPGPRVTPIQKGVLVGLAIVLPLGAWVLIGAGGWWRRRRVTVR